jgi:hypothetical protein
MPAHEYRANKEYISPSDIKGVTTPLGFITKQQQPSERKESFEVGTAAHTLILEPDKFSSQVVIIPRDQFPEPEKIDEDGCIKLSIAANGRHYKKVMSMNPRKAVITGDHYGMLLKMQTSVKALKGIDIALDLPNAYVENSFYARVIFTKEGQFEKIEPCEDNEKYGELDVLVKTRPDYVHRDKPINLDFKTTQSVDQRSFASDCGRYEYDIQGAMGLDIISANIGKVYNIFLILAVEKHPPYDSVIFDLASEDLMKAKGEYLWRLNMIREARNSGVWKGVAVHSDNDFPLLQLNLSRSHSERFHF